MSRGIPSSRISGFYKRSIPERIDLLSTSTSLDDESRAYLEQGGGLDLSVADAMSENVVAVHGLPLSMAMNFRVNEHDYIVPMAVEEPSVVAAASNAALMIRESGGFFGDADSAIMTAQIQFDEVVNPQATLERIYNARAQILTWGDEAIPNIVARSGGCRDLEVRILEENLGIVVVHIYVDVGDAMGANVVDTLAEQIAPQLHRLMGGQLGLRILSNLPLRRCVRVRAEVNEQTLGGSDVANAIAKASRFAELDLFRAVTHNKGFMNGLDAAAIAIGQDWRSIEAAVHAYASLNGRYRPISTWHRTANGLLGQAEFPLAVGTVGGATRAHAGVRTAFRVLKIQSARELSVVLASVGLASNLAALRVLATEGIQKGHMNLHRRKQFFYSEPPKSSNSTIP